MLIKRLKQWLVDLWIGLQSDKEALFTKYYLANSWGSLESKSGIGSTLEHTARLRAQLPDFFREYRVKSILDAPCGDFNWFKHVHRPCINYIGGDIVRPLVELNNRLYADKYTRFLSIDITKDPLPAADVWLCRDALFHLSERDIYLALSNFLRSDIPYLLTTTFPGENENRDIPTGSFRMINLEKNPFCFEPPLTVLVDSVEGWQTRLLGLWGRDAVRKVILKNPF